MILLIGASNLNFLEFRLSILTFPTWTLTNVVVRALNILVPRKKALDLLRLVILVLDSLRVNPQSSNLLRIFSLISEASW